MSSAAQSSQRTFDGCDACSDVALDAIIQSALYVISHVAPDALGRPADALNVSFRLRVRLEDENGADIAVDEIEVDQSISIGGAVGSGDAVGRGGAVGSGDAVGRGPNAAEARGDAATEAHSSIEDFQAMIDRVHVGPSGDASMAGVIAGRLFGFERLIGQFEVLIGAC